MKPLPLRAAALFAGALLASPCAPSLAASQLFKCVEGVRTVYQQQACSVSSQPEAAASGPRLAANAGAPAADTASAAPRRLKSSSAASSAPATPR